MAVAAAVHPIAAQEVASERPPQIPATFTPPAGLCRVWLDGVPASQQPAPTDCASAIKNRPAGSAVVFGPKRRSESSELESFMRRAGLPASRDVTPNALRARRLTPNVPAARQLPPDAPSVRARDDARSRAADTAAKPVRKPEKPQ